MSRRDRAARLGDPYLEAAERVPVGQTRSFRELAVMAGRPGAARAAGRAIARCRSESHAAAPWHRIVSADGALAKDGATAREQLRRLRREGARPKASETIAAWAARVGAGRVGYYPRRVHAAPADPRLGRWRPERVEPLADERRARERGFRSIDAPRAQRSAPFPSPRRVGQAPRRPLSARLAPLVEDASRERLLDEGVLHVPGVLGAAECDAVLDAAAREPDRFERSVEMGSRGFGVGEYHYFREPLPEPAGSLRALLYDRLRGLAGEFVDDGESSFPPTLEGFHRRCREAGQRRGSCILLCYGEGGVNHPHRDIYGRVWFPLQALVVLSRRGRDFEGGDFVLFEEGASRDRRPVPADRGDLVVFASRDRPASRAARHERVPLRHGMDPVTRGERFALGIVLHLAK